MLYVKLVKKANPAVLQRMVENQDVRAAAYFPFGCFEGMLFSNEITARNAQSSTLLAEDCALPFCADGIIRGFVSQRPTLEVVGFALLTPAPGALQVVTDHVDAAGRDLAEDMVQESSTVLGNCEPWVLVEVLGRTEDSVLDHLSRVVDVEQAKVAKTLLTFGELTYGFGNAPRPASDDLAPTAVTPS